MVALGRKTTFPGNLWRLRCGVTLVTKQSKRLDITSNYLTIQLNEQAMASFAMIAARDVHVGVHIAVFPDGELEQRPERKLQAKLLTYTSVRCSTVQQSGTAQRIPPFALFECNNLHSTIHPCSKCYANPLRLDSMLVDEVAPQNLAIAYASFPFPQTPNGCWPI
nr:hypothetical protein CFP56_42122 [Quercus suber]